MPVDTKLDSGDGWEAHRAFVEAAKPRRGGKKRGTKNTVKFGTVKKMDPRDRRLHQFCVRYGYTSRDLRREAARLRSYSYQSQITPEQRKANTARAIAVKKIRAQICEHRKLAPKLRKKGKFAGQWCCPSCLQPVPAPPLPGEGIVT